MASQVKVGFIHGTGAALNFQLGWVPDWVRIVNLTDGDKVFENFLGKVIAFTSGGTTVIKKGDVIRGLTNTGTYATIRQVILDSGSWAGGDAAGWFIINAEDITGNFGSENAELNDSGTNDVTVALEDEDGIDIDTEVTATTTAATNVQSYIGSSAANSKGFTLGATVSEDGKLLGFVALRNADEEADLDQTTVL